LIYDNYVNWDHSDDNQLYACCPLHVERTPSFTVNKDTGEWYCFGCGKGGSEKEFIQAYYDVDAKVAAHVLDYYERKLKLPFPTDEDIELWHKKLLASPREMEAVHSFGFRDELINSMKIGLEDIRITFPIKSRTGHYVNVRKYLPPHRRLQNDNSQKCINIKGLGQRRYYPYDAFDSPAVIVIVEGEKDCIAARSQGINAVTGTGGSAIPFDEISLFNGKDVAIMVDTDSVGQRSTKAYTQLLKAIVKSLQIITLPDKDFVEYYERTGDANIWQFAAPYEDYVTEVAQTEAQDVSLLRSEFTENLNTWVKLRAMSVVGVEPRIYSIPQKLKISCNNLKCSRPCPVMSGPDKSRLMVDVDARQMLQFVDSADSAMDTYVKKLFGCKYASAEGSDFINVQKLIFQESASFIDGLDEATFENRYGVYTYTDYRLSATLKYDFETCRVTDPRSQQNYYVIRDAENVTTARVQPGEVDLARFQEVATESISAAQLIQHYYDEWLPVLAIEGRPDLFGAMLLTFCSVTEIPWRGGLLKGWLDVMVIGDTRTGKSQMAQRFVKTPEMGSYINGENARRTGVIGGVQRFGDSWVVTWGAIPMNDRGLLIIDEASGLDVEDIKDLSSTRSSGAVTLNKIVKGEARARTRLVWLSNPRSGRNLSEFYWKGFGAFQEFIPVIEDQARFDLVLTAAQEDVDVPLGVDVDKKPRLQEWHALIKLAWSLEADDINIQSEVRDGMRDVVKKLTDDLGGGCLVVGVAVHEKLLRLSCAFAMLCGSVNDNGKLIVGMKHLQFADEFLRSTLNKSSFGYGDYIREFKRAQSKRNENMTFIRTLITANPAIKALLTANSFKGFQFQEIMGIDKADSSKMLSELITRGLLRPGSNATYIPDKLLMELAKQMEV
jgi:hypothetical protein